MIENSIETPPDNSSR